MTCLVPRADLAMRVAKRIAYLRTASGITQEELASRLEIALKNVQRIESGRQNLTLSSVERIAVALRVDVRELFAKATAARQPEMRASATRRKLDGLAGPGRVVVNVGAEDPPPRNLLPAQMCISVARPAGAHNWLSSS